MSEERERIDRHACDAHLEMQVRSGAIASRSHEGDRLSRCNHVARLHERPLEMAVERGQLRISGEENVKAVATARAAHRNGAGRGGVDRRAEASGKVEPPWGGVASAV